MLSTAVGPAPFYLHSPSGCTFWGKRPWSRTRKILWQLGMVLGAPMVISLVAGIAVPVITIGIPVYMGRKVLAGGPGVPVILLPCEPQAWTDTQYSPLHVPVSALTPHSPHCGAPRCCPPQYQLGTVSLERWELWMIERRTGFGAQGCFPGTPE